MAAKVALVTGGNQGLGFALVEALCRLDGQWAVYLGARDRGRGEAAVKSLEGKGLSPKLLIIDVSEGASVESAAAEVAATHGGLDLLVGNAAMRMAKDLPPAGYVRDFCNTNNAGTTRLLRAFLPLLRPGGCLCVVASSFGSLTKLPESLHGRFPLPATLEDVDKVMDAYVVEVESGTAAAAGWPEWVNVPSKVGQVWAVKVAAQDPRVQEAGVRVVAACPGLVDTDASRPWFGDMSKAASPAEAAVDVVWLCCEAEGHHGELVQKREVIPWQ